jgi:hypothetical protein
VFVSVGSLHAQRVRLATEVDVFIHRNQSGKQSAGKCSAAGELTEPSEI